MTEQRSFLEILARAALKGARSFVGTFFLFAFVGIVLAVVSARVLEDHTALAILSAVIAVLEGIAVGLVYGFRRSVVVAALHALEALRLGQTVLRLLFERMQVRTATPGTPNAGRLTLIQFEEGLNTAAADVTGDPEIAGGFGRRQLHSMLVGEVQHYTREEFRRTEAQDANVDLSKVRSLLEANIDKQLTARFRRALRWWSILAIVGFPALVALQTYLLLLLARAP